ncbi:MAG: hypothetical protein OXF98_12010 [Rhodospirillaceae bacterium]|nr:hypothetical protein [Rhodospirillaceae bacterium]
MQGILKVVSQELRAFLSTGRVPITVIRKVNSGRSWTNSLAARKQRPLHIELTTEEETYTLPGAVFRQGTFLGVGPASHKAGQAKAKW